MMQNSKALLSVALLTGVSLAQTTTSGASGSSSSGANDAECTQSYASLFAAVPKPDGELASAITSYASGVIQTASGTNANPLAFATQVCEFSAGLPSSLHSDFDAYASQVISFVSASSSDIDAVITNCVATGTDGAAYTSLVNSLATQTGPLCQATGTGTGVPYSTANGTVTTGTPTPTTTGVNGGGGATTTSVPTGAAAVPTAVLGGVAAAAGLLGAIVLL
ncbi:hypothetical protein F4803DRAFT_97460 [Xylaria telfairii]|nr:hypothetical protein F4803DRAFT_97460 [Xylaria telfairii]